MHDNDDNLIESLSTGMGELQWAVEENKLNKVWKTLQQKETNKKKISIKVCQIVTSPDVSDVAPLR